MPAERRSRSTEAFFGCRCGKAIRPLQAGALSSLADYLLDLQSVPPRLRDCEIPAFRFRKATLNLHSNFWFLWKEVNIEYIKY
jgi:hypothetical protein